MTPLRLETPGGGSAELALPEAMPLLLQLFDRADGGAFFQVIILPCMVLFMDI
jgi:hypothetical protein